MSKKLLDAAVAVTFCICLIVTSNVEEKCAEAKLARSEENSLVVAGVSSVIFQNSFTTESDEYTSVEKKQTAVVAAQEEGAAMQPTVIIEETEEKTADIPAEEAADVTAEETEEEAADIIIEETEENYENRWGIMLTEEEINLLARIVWLEARGESALGQEAVVEVVFNRMASEIFPNTLQDVLSQKNPVQFCSWKNRENAMPTEKEYESIERVLRGNTSILRSDTMYFSRVALTRNLDVRIGEHSFCY
jgi:N-acetylmuramoyl-L-alanine amidase